MSTLPHRAAPPPPLQQQQQQQHTEAAVMEAPDKVRPKGRRDTLLSDNAADGGSPASLRGRLSEGTLHRAQAASAVEEGAPQQLAELAQVAAARGGWAADYPDTRTLRGAVTSSEDAYTRFETALLEEVNALRADPRAYAAVVETYATVGYPFVRDEDLYFERDDAAEVVVDWRPSTSLSRPRLSTASHNGAAAEEEDLAATTGVPTVLLPCGGLCGEENTVRAAGLSDLTLAQLRSHIARQQQYRTGIERALQEIKTHWRQAQAAQQELWASQDDKSAKRKKYASSAGGKKNQAAANAVGGAPSEKQLQREQQREALDAIFKSSLQRFRQAHAATQRTCTRAIAAANLLLDTIRVLQDAAPAPPLQSSKGLTIAARDAVALFHETVLPENCGLLAAPRVGVRLPSAVPHRLTESVTTDANFAATTTEMSKIEMDLEEMQEAAAAHMVEPATLQYEVNTLAAAARQCCERYGYIADEVQGLVWYGADSPRGVVLKLLLGTAEPQFCLKATTFPLQSTPPPPPPTTAAEETTTAPFVNMFEPLFRDDLNDNSDAAAACGYVWEGHYHAGSLQAAQHHDAAVAAATTSQQRRAAAAQRRLGPLLWAEATLLGCGWQRVYAPRGVPAFQHDRGTTVHGLYGASRAAAPAAAEDGQQQATAPTSAIVATTVLLAHGYETLEAVRARANMSVDEVRRFIQTNCTGTNTNTVSTSPGGGEGGSGMSTTGGGGGAGAAPFAVIDLHSTLGVSLLHPRRHPVPVDPQQDRTMVIALRAVAAQIGAALCAADPPAEVPPTPLAAPELLVQRSLTDPTAEAVLLLDVQAALRRFGGRSFVVHLYERRNELAAEDSGAGAAGAEAAAPAAALTGFRRMGMVRYVVHLPPTSGSAVRTVATLRQTTTSQVSTHTAAPSTSSASDLVEAAAYTSGLDLSSHGGCNSDNHTHMMTSNNNSSSLDDAAAGWPSTTNYFQEREGTIIAPLRYMLNPPDTHSLHSMSGGGGAAAASMSAPVRSSDAERLCVRVAVQFRARGEAAAQASPQVVALQQMIAKLEVENKIDERGTSEGAERDALLLVPDEVKEDEALAPPSPAELRSCSLSTAAPPTPHHPGTATPGETEAAASARLVPAEVLRTSPSPPAPAPVPAPPASAKKKNKTPSPPPTKAAAAALNASITSVAASFDVNRCDQLLQLPPLTAALPKTLVLRAAAPADLEQHLASLPLRENEAAAQALQADAGRCEEQLAEAQRTVAPRVAYLEKEVHRKKGKEQTKAKEELAALQEQLEHFTHEVEAVRAAATTAQNATRKRSRSAVLRVARLADLQQQLAQLKLQQQQQQPPQLTSPRLGERRSVQGTTATAALWLVPRPHGRTTPPPPVPRLTTAAITSAHHDSNSHTHSNNNNSSTNQSSGTDMLFPLEAAAAGSEAVLYESSITLPANFAGKAVLLLDGKEVVSWMVDTKA